MNENTEKTQYHYILTLQWAVPGGGIATHTAHGTVDINPEFVSDADLYDYVMKVARERSGCPLGPSVLFYRAVPNQL